MPKTLSSKNIDGKFLVTCTQQDLPIGSIVFWHDHRAAEKEKKPNQHLIDPEIVSHVGIIINYQDSHPVVAHAAYEKNNPKKGTSSIQSVIACRLRAIDNNIQGHTHSFIAFKPNTKEYKYRSISKAMVNIAKKMTHRDKKTKESDYDIPYGVKRSEAMSLNIRNLLTNTTQKHKKITFESILADATAKQKHETRYAFYRYSDYTKTHHTNFSTSDNPIKRKAGALVPFKVMAKFNHSQYQEHQKNKNEKHFTSQGWHCSQFIIQLIQFAIIQSTASYDPLHCITGSVSEEKIKTRKIQTVAKYSRKNKNKPQIKKLMDNGIDSSDSFFIESIFETLFAGFDYDGKMLAPGTLMKILLDQSDGGDGGNGETMFTVDYFYTTKETARAPKTIIDGIGDLIGTFNELNLSHKLNIRFDQYKQMIEVCRDIQDVLNLSRRSKPREILQHRSIQKASQQSMFSSVNIQENQSPISHNPINAHCQIHYLANFISVAKLVLIKKIERLQRKRSISIFAPSTQGREKRSRPTPSARR